MKDVMMEIMGGVAVLGFMLAVLVIAAAVNCAGTQLGWWGVAQDEEVSR